MAMTFSFALIGAMLLCFTYVPVVSSLFLRAKVQSPKNISLRLMNFLNKRYQPIIYWSLDHKKVVVLFSMLLLGFSIWIFTRMGGEFVPTLDEGDFVIQPLLKTGTSLLKNR